MEFNEILKYIEVKPETEFIEFKAEGKEVAFIPFAPDGFYEVTFDKTLTNKIEEKGKYYEFIGVRVVQYNKDKKIIMESYFSTVSKTVQENTYYFYENGKRVRKDRYQYTNEGNIQSLIRIYRDNTEDSEFQKRLLEMNKMSYEEAGY